MSRSIYAGPYTVLTAQKNACKSWGSLPEHEDLTLERAREVFRSYNKWRAVSVKIVKERAPVTVASRYSRIS
jgi:hypothetical protein